jgi:hypothetical protein
VYSLLFDLDGLAVLFTVNSRLHISWDIEGDSGSRWGTANLRGVQSGHLAVKQGDRPTKIPWMGISERPCSGHRIGKSKFLLCMSGLLADTCNVTLTPIDSCLWPTTK